MNKPFDLHAYVAAIQPSTILIREETVPDAVYLLIRGRVRLMRRRVVTGWITEGYAPFGLEALQGRRSVHACVSPADGQIEVARIPAGIFPEVVARLPQAAVRMFLALSARERTLVEAMEAAAEREDAVARQWKLLTRIFEDLAERGGVPDLAHVATWLKNHPFNQGPAISVTDPLVLGLPHPIRELLIRLSVPLQEKSS